MTSTRSLCPLMHTAGADRLLSQTYENSRAMTLAYGTGCGDPAAHGLDKALRDCEAKACSLPPVGGLLHAAELLEDAFELGGWDAAAIVLDADHDVVAILVGGQFDRRTIW